MQRSVPPRICITMGDPAGIGPEITCKACGSGKLSPHKATWVITGDYPLLERTAHLLGLSLNLYRITTPDEISEEKINVLDCSMLPSPEPPPPVATAQCGNAAFRYVTTAIECALHKKIDAIVTNPINKHALRCADIPFEGHTEILAHKTNTEDYAMCFILDGVFVIHVTTHCSLRDAISRIDHNRVLRIIRLLERTLKQFGIDTPRIAVAGLNPHAGEEGMFGTEEIEHITPAVTRAQQQGCRVQGPFPPDTVFHRAFNAEFDGIVSMLHDHGFVALKTLGFERCVNYTAGLPFIRTSVGHGTAFDIAGRNRASVDNLLSAIDAALRFCTRSDVTL